MQMMYPSHEELCPDLAVQSNNCLYHSCEAKNVILEVRGEERDNLKCYSCTNKPVNTRAMNNKLE